MPLKELFMNVKNNASTETVQSAIIFPIFHCNSQNVNKACGNF